MLTIGAVVVLISFQFWSTASNPATHERPPGEVPGDDHPPDEASPKQREYVFRTLEDVQRHVWQTPEGDPTTWWGFNASRQKAYFDR